MSNLTQQTQRVAATAAMVAARAAPWSKAALDLLGPAAAEHQTLASGSVVATLPAAEVAEAPARRAPLASKILSPVVPSPASYAAS